MTDKDLERYLRLEAFLNMVGKSGIVNPKPIIAQMAILLDLKPEDIFYGKDSLEGDN
jgi:hypothetical protein